MNNRMVEYVEISNLINYGQIRFKKSIRTTDRIFTLKCQIHMFMITKRNYTLCFIDLKKAFDSICHKGLFNKLEINNINGKFLDFLKIIFMESKVQLK